MARRRCADRGQVLLVTQRLARPVAARRRRRGRRRAPRSAVGAPRWPRPRSSAPARTAAASSRPIGVEHRHRALERARRAWAVAALVAVLHRLARVAPRRRRSRRRRPRNTERRASANPRRPPLVPSRPSSMLSSSARGRRIGIVAAQRDRPGELRARGRGRVLRPARRFERALGVDARRVVSRPSGCGSWPPPSTGTRARAARRRRACSAASASSMTRIAAGQVTAHALVRGDGDVRPHRTRAVGRHAVAQRGLR